MPSCVYSFSDHFANGEPLIFAAARAISTNGIGVDWVRTTSSGSTSVVQSSSVTEFHCDAIPLL